jgi:hypothetical protein
MDVTSLPTGEPETGRSAVKPDGVMDFVHYRYLPEGEPGRKLWCSQAYRKLEDRWADGSLDFNEFIKVLTGYVSTVDGPKRYIDLLAPVATSHMEQELF